MDQKKPGGCQDGCPLGKVLGQRECPGKKAKERLVEWLKREAPKNPDAKPGEAPSKPGQGK